MKKLILKSLIFFSVLAIIIGICNWGYLRTDSFNTDKFRHVPDQIEICNIGASHSLYGFNYENFEEKYTTFNFGLDSQSHQYDYIILNHYKENIKKGAFVFIVVSYPMLIGKDETESESFGSKNKRYYTFLYADEIRKYDFKTDLNMKLVPFTNVSSLRRLLSNIIMGGGTNYWSRQTNAEEVVLDATKAAMRHVGEKSDEQGLIRYNQGAIEALYNIIELCKELEAIPILITTPFTNEYLSEVKRLAPEYYDHEFSDCIQKIQEDTGVAYYDYSRDERFKTDYSIFLNSDHLNIEGARQFTDIVMEEVLGNKYPHVLQ